MARLSGFQAADKPMRIMADLLRRGRNADEIMKVRRMEEKGGGKLTTNRIEMIPVSVEAD